MSPDWGKDQISNFPRVPSLGGLEADSRVGVKDVKRQGASRLTKTNAHIYTIICVYMCIYTYTQIYACMYVCVYTRV